MTLRTRLTLAVAAIVAVAVFAGAVASLYSTNSELRSETDKFLLTRSQRFTQDGGRGFELGGPPDRGRGREQQPLVDFDAVTQVINSSGTVVSALPDQPLLPVDQRDATLARSGATTTVRFRDVTVGGVDYRMVTAPLRSGGAVQIARAVTETNDVLRVLRNRLVLIVLFGTALAAMVAWALARRTIRPIQNLTATTERIASTQDLATPIPVAGDDEVARLSASFNSMLAALATSRDQQKRLIADASHELRTPLTAVRTNIEFLERAGTLDPTERQALLSETRLELAELTTLVAELVELATDARSDEPITEVDLAQVADDVAARFRRRSGREITVTVQDAEVVDGRRAMLERAVSNLVDNALKFSDPPAAVDITVDHAAIEVADRGPGIAPEHRTRVFDRFYRSDAARARPGSGLGLSIVAQIAAVHVGTVSVHGRPGGGTVARLELPFDTSHAESAPPAPSNATS